MKLNTRKTCIAAALAFSAAGAASSAMAVTLIGGGSSLVGPSIQSEISQFMANTDSLTYFITSSGVGQTAFLGNLPTAFQSGLTGNVAFANSDAALTTPQITSYATSTLATTDGDGPLIQIPYITTAITVPIVNGPLAAGAPSDTFLGPQTTPSQAHSLALNDTDLCGIFSGKMTTWNQVTNPDTNAAFNDTAAINVVYRSDSSGTSELLSRHLAAVCPALTGSTVVNSTTTVTFIDSTTFANTTAFPNGVPSNFHAASGSQGVQTELTTLASAGTAGVAYISPDWTNTFLAPSSSSASAQLAVASLVNSHITNSPLGTADIAPTFTQADNAISTVTGTTGASPVPITRLRAVNPANWVPAAGNPTAGYPVSGTSQIILSECYNNSASNVSGSMINFLNLHYSNATYKAIIQGNGFDVPTAYVSAIQNEILANVGSPATPATPFSPALNINGSECPTSGGR